MQVNEIDRLARLDGDDGRDFRERLAQVRLESQAQRGGACGAGGARTLEDQTDRAVVVHPGQLDIATIGDEGRPQAVENRLHAIAQC